MFKVGKTQVGDHVLDWNKEDTIKAFKDSPLNGEQIWKFAQAEKAARKKAAEEKAKSKK